MAINFVCSCGRKLKASDEQAGITAPCPKCGNLVTAPLLIYHDSLARKDPPVAKVIQSPASKQAPRQPELLTEPVPTPVPDTQNRELITQQWDYRPMTLTVVGIISLTALAFYFSSPIGKPPSTSKASASQTVTPKVKATFKISDNFRSQLMSYLKTAGKLNALSSQGVRMNDFEKQLAEVRSELDLLEHTWPKDHKDVGLPSFQASITGFDTARKLWQLRLDGKGVPMEPDVNDYREFVSIGGRYLDVNTYQNDDPKPDLRGKKYIPFDPNISIFLSMGNKLFEIGRDEIIELIK